MYDLMVESQFQIDLTEPQLPQVLEPPAIAAEHFGQVLCMVACDFCFEEDSLEIIQGQSLTMARSCLLSTLRSFGLSV